MCSSNIVSHGSNFIPNLQRPTSHTSHFAKLFSLLFTMTLTTRNSAKKGTQGIQTRGGSNRSNLAANSSTASLPANKRPPSKAHPKGRPPANHHDQEEEEEVSVKKRKASTISKAPRKGSTPALETDDMSLAEKMQMLKHLQKDLEGMYIAYF
jgi:hypothetical protein